MTKIPKTDAAITRRLHRLTSAYGEAGAKLNLAVTPFALVAVLWFAIAKNPSDGERLKGTATIDFVTRDNITVLVARYQDGNTAQGPSGNK